MIRWIVRGAVLALLVVLAVPAVRHWREQTPTAPQPLRAFWVPADPLTVGAGTNFPFGGAIAPDGRQFAFPAAHAGAVRLWLQDLSTGQSRALPSTDGAVLPFWSPDGRRVGFFADGKMRAIDLSSGSVHDLADAPAPRGGTWNAAGEIAFAPGAGGGLMVRSTDGSVTSFTTIDEAQRETSHRWPAFLADGRHVAYLVRAAEASREGIWMAAIDQPASTRRVVGADAQAIVAGTTLLFASDEALMAQPLDPATGSPVGRATLVGLPVGRGPLDQLFATATPEVLVYSAPGTTLRELRWVERDGVEVARLGEPVEAWDLRVAPDNARVAVTELDAQLRTLDVWIQEGGQPVPRRLSPSTSADEGAVWSPDGTRVAWVSGGRRVTIRGAGAVLPEQVVATFDPPVRTWDWSRDGRWLVVGRSKADTREDLWLVPSSGTGEARAYTTAAFNQRDGVVSPDGRFMAYASDESGHFDLYVDTFPTPHARTRVTTAGGTEPRWRRDGRELYFRRGSEVHVVTFGDVASGARVESGIGRITSARLFDTGLDLRAYDVSADGRRFLLNLPGSSHAPRAASLVVNWLRTP